jgi:hypothetical protein
MGLFAECRQRIAAPPRTISRDVDRNPAMAERHASVAIPGQ